MQQGKTSEAATLGTMRTRLGSGGWVTEVGQKEQHRLPDQPVIPKEMKAGCVAARPLSHDEDSISLSGLEQAGPLSPVSHPYQAYSLISQPHHTSHLLSHIEQAPPYQAWSLPLTSPPSSPRSHLFSHIEQVPVPGLELCPEGPPQLPQHLIAAEMAQFGWREKV